MTLTTISLSKKEKRNEYTINHTKENHDRKQKRHDIFVHLFLYIVLRRERRRGGGYVANLRTSADDDSASGSSSLALFRGIRQNGGRLIFFFWFFGKVYKYARLSLSFRKGYTHTHTIQHLREGMTILLQEICLNEIS